MVVNNWFVQMVGSTVMVCKLAGPFRVDFRKDSCLKLTLLQDCSSLPSGSPRLYAIAMTM